MYQMRWIRCKRGNAARVSYESTSPTLFEPELRILNVDLTIEVSTLVSYFTSQDTTKDVYKTCKRYDDIHRYFTVNKEPSASRH